MLTSGLKDGFEKKKIYVVLVSVIFSSTSNSFKGEHKVGISEMLN